MLKQWSLDSDACACNGNLMNLVIWGVVMNLQMPWQAKTEFTPLVLQPARTGVPPSAQIRTTAAAVVRSVPVVLTASGYAKNGTVSFLLQWVDGCEVNVEKDPGNCGTEVWLATSYWADMRRTAEVAFAGCIVLRDLGLTITSTTTWAAACRSDPERGQQMRWLRQTYADALNGDLRQPCADALKHLLGRGLWCELPLRVSKFWPQCQHGMRGRDQQRPH